MHVQNKGCFMNVINQFGEYNLTNKKNREIKYIVIHYTAGTTSKSGTAKSTAKYFNKETTKASADFIVDDEFVVQFNPDIKNKYCWHCGGSKYKTQGGSLYKICTSANSIGIEVCSSNSAKKVTNPNDTNWYFTDDAVKNTLELVKQLMQEYDIDVDHIIRHYDVNGKQPLPVDCTELLTPNGWKYITELNIGDIVMTYDMASEKMKFDKIINILPIWTDTVLKRRCFEATYEHRMLYMPNCKNSHEWKIDKWGELNEGKKLSKLKTCALLEDYNKLDIDDDMLRLIVWVQADGSYFEDKQYLEFHFKKTRKIDRVIELLNKLNIKYTICNQTDGTIKIRSYDNTIVTNCEKYLKDKKFAWNLLNLSHEQFLILFNEIFLADGTLSSNKQMYFSTIKSNIDIIQALFAINNIRCKLSKTGHNENILYDTINVHNTNYTVGYKNKLEQRQTDVTCVTVPSGLILVRQNNQTFITGNCPGIIGWNKDTGDESKWEAFKTELIPAEIAKVEETVQDKTEVVIEEPKPVITLGDVLEAIESPDMEPVELPEVKVEPDTTNVQRLAQQETQKQKGLLERLINFIKSFFK